MNRNEDLRVPIAPIFNSSDVYAPIQPQFIERIYIYKYFGVSDIMKAMGGLNAFIRPILAAFVPYFVIHFLYSLSKILLFKYE